MRTNEPSILITSRGSSRRRAKLCIPVPKSSMAMRHPSARRSASRWLAAAVLEMAAVSVTSKHKALIGSGEPASSVRSSTWKLIEARL